jgi:DNA-binding MarR family transcriptional regulator
MRRSDGAPGPAGPATVNAMLDQLGEALGVVRCAGSQRLLRLGISMTHLHVLTLLRHHGPLPMSRIAEFLGGSMSSATGIVDRMEERDLVERHRVPGDRRVVLVHPTSSGEALVDEVEIVRSDLARSVLERLDAGQLERLAAAISDLRASVAAELGSAPERYAAFLSHDHAGAERA